MGRKNKRKRNSNNNQEQDETQGTTTYTKQKKTRRYAQNRFAQQRRERYWVEDCRETPPIVDPRQTPSLTVLITRVELVDNHTYGPGGHPAAGHPAAAAAVEEVTNPSLSSVVITGANAESTTNDLNPSTISAAAVADAAADPVVVVDDKSGKEQKNASLPIDRTAVINDLQTAKNTEINENRSSDPKTENVKNAELEVVVAACSKTENRPGTPPSSAASINPNAEDKSSPSEVVATICVRRDDSAKLTKRKPEKFRNNNNHNHATKFRHLPDGDCGDGIKNPYPKYMVADKYWAQRHRLFSRFDQGIQLDQESWYSVTPEAIANHIARKMIERLTTTTTAAEAAATKNARLLSNNDSDRNGNNDTNDDSIVIVDAFCGAGGNAVAFARQAKVSLVVCLDIDESKLRLAAHNARIYDIPDHKLVFIHGDACDILGQYENGVRRPAVAQSTCSRNNDHAVHHPDTEATKTTAELPLADDHGYRLGGLDLLPQTLDAVFLSPPWGGMNYEDIGAQKFDLKCVVLENDMDGERILEYSSRAVPSSSNKKGRRSSIAFFLPRNTNGLEVGKSALKAGITGTLEVEQNVLNDKFKAITIYT